MCQKQEKKHCDPNAYVCLFGNSGLIKFSRKFSSTGLRQTASGNTTLWNASSTSSRISAAPTPTMSVRPRERSPSSIGRIGETSLHICRAALRRKISNQSIIRRLFKCPPTSRGAPKVPWTQDLPRDRDWIMTNSERDFLPSSMHPPLEDCLLTKPT